MKTVLGADLAPQRPRYAREKAELASHILEPEWLGKRAIARVGHGGPRFVGYGGEVDGPRELFDAIVAEARCTTAIIDGVLVSGCHPGDCHYISGNYIGRRKSTTLKRFVEFLGIEEGRVQFSWVSAAEGGKFSQVVDEVTQGVKKLGPIKRFVKR